jgi:DNA-3-methyladenine glycosylase
LGKLDFFSQLVPFQALLVKNMTIKILTPDFYDRSVVTVARGLLGMRLVRSLDNLTVAGIITETEAYDGEKDMACHAHVGITRRNEVMFGPPGRAYVYFSYGMHWLLNCVTGIEGYPAAVLIRSIFPTENIEEIARRRFPAKEKDWCNGPAKLTQALSIDKQLNGMNLCSKNSRLYIEQADSIPDEFVIATPRIGIRSVPEPWRSKLWRFQAFLPINWFEQPYPHK